MVLLQTRVYVCSSWESQHTKGSLLSKLVPEVETRLKRRAEKLTGKSQVRAATEAITQYQDLPAATEKEVSDDDITSEVETTEDDSEPSADDWESV